MRRQLGGLLIVVALGFSISCGEEEAAPAAEADVGSENGMTDATTDSTSGTISPDARMPPSSAHEVEFVFENAKNEAIYVRTGPECLHRGPGWVFVESRVREETPFLTSACSDCSCVDPEIGFGCSCACPDSRQSEQTEIHKLPPGESVSWTWSGQVYARESSDACDAARPPPADRLAARFCWRASESGPEGCWSTNFSYGETTFLRATIRSK